MEPPPPAPLSNPAPSGISTGTSTKKVSSKFVSSNEIEEAQQRRENEWKEAFKRAHGGREASEEEVVRRREELMEGERDTRTLFEKLKEVKDKKQEDFEEQLKFKNQFRALDEDEIHFLDSVSEDKRSEEKRREDETKKELERFRKAVAERNTTTAPSTSTTSGNEPHTLSIPGTSNASLSSAVTNTATTLASRSEPPSVASATTTAALATTAVAKVQQPTKSKKKDQRDLLKGAIVKKGGGKGSTAVKRKSSSGGENEKEKDKVEGEGQSKKRKVEDGKS